MANDPLDTLYIPKMYRDVILELGLVPVVTNLLNATSIALLQNQWTKAITSEISGSSSIVEEQFTGEVAAVNADTILALELTSIATHDNFSMFLNGQLQSLDFDYTVAGKKITWLGGVAPGTGTAEFAIAVTDSITVIYQPAV